MNHLPTNTARARSLAHASLVRALALLAGACLTLHSAAAFAPPERPLWQQALAEDPSDNAMEPPPRSSAVEAILSAPFLREDEARELRITFGAATDADLTTPAHKARWALIRGVLDDPALLDESAPALDRAEGQAQRGEARAALATLDTLAPAERAGMRAVRIAVQALEALGEEAAALIRAAPALELLRTGTGKSADEVAEAVTTATLLTRLVTPGEGAGRDVPDHKALMAALKRSREELDPQHLGTLLAESRLLYEKDNFKQAIETAREALALNPLSAEAWGLFGRLTVDSFNMPAARQVANRLDVIARGEGSSHRHPSPLAAIVRARAALRLSDPEGAEKALAPALSAFPDHRALRETAAAASALRFDPAATAALLNAYDALAAGPDVRPRAAAYFEAGRALGEARQYAQAAALLKTAIERQPDWPQPQIELGLLYIQSGQDQEALDTLQSATALDPFNQRASNCLALIRDLVTYERHESEHFVVRAKPGLDALVARELLAGLEDNHARVCANTGPGLRYEPPFKTLIDYLPDHRAFGVRIVGMPAIHTIAASTGPLIAMEAPREGRNHQGTYDWQRVLRHEYTHTVGLTRTGNRMPHWFTEAQAVYLEEAPRDYPTCQLLARVFAEDQLFDFTQINIAFVRPEKPSDRAQGYAQGHWMYAYLVHRFGEEAPLKLMDAYAQGTREEQAYRAVLKVSRQEFLDGFRAYAENDLRAWGMLEKAGEPTLGELLERAIDARATPGDEELTETELATLLEKHPVHADLLELAVARAVSANAGEPTPEMVPLLERYGAARPVDPLPHKLLARLYLAQAPVGSGAPQGGGGPLDAIPHLEYLDAREDRLPTYAGQLASLYAQSGDLQKARARAERATRIAPYDARYRELAAGMALRSGPEGPPPDLKTARRHIFMLTQLEPDRPVHARRLEAIDARLNERP